MEIINVTSGEQLERLYNSSALTLEGLAAESILDFMEWVKERTEVKNEIVYITKGEIMNDFYNLTGGNKYPKDLTIVSISGDDINLMPLAFARFEIGARWFDDIVDNNLRRE